MRCLDPAFPRVLLRPLLGVALALPTYAALTVEIAQQDAAAMFNPRGASARFAAAIRLPVATNLESAPSGTPATAELVYGAGISYGPNGPVLLHAPDGRVTGSLQRGDVRSPVGERVNRAPKSDLWLTKVERGTERDEAAANNAAEWFASAFGHSDLAAPAPQRGFDRALPRIDVRLDANAPLPPERPDADEAADAAFTRLSQLSIKSHTDLEKAHHCLSEAIYFESRSEPERGQQAVAQVVLNRVKSGIYPNNVCDVVFQHRNWRNRCQFSFACDGTTPRVADTNAWDTASRIADDALNGRVFLPDVGDATHYHANYVAPRWRRYLTRTQRIGAHIFYSMPGVEINSSAGS